MLSLSTRYRIILDSFWFLNFGGKFVFSSSFQLFCYATNNIWSAGFLYIVRCQHEIYLSHMTTFSLAVRLTPLITFRMNKKKIEILSHIQNGEHREAHVVVPVCICTSILKQPPIFITVCETFVTIMSSCCLLFLCIDKRAVISNCAFS